MISVIDSFKASISIFSELKKKGIIDDYALIGGLALSAWVKPRTTRDVDIVVVTSKNVTWAELGALIGSSFQKRVAFQEGTRRTNIKEKLSFKTGQIEVDVISTTGFDLAVEALERAVTATVFGKKVKVVTPEYLVLLKLLPLSSQDAVDIVALMEKTDKRKVTSLAKKHFLFPKLQKLLAKRIH